MPFLKRFKINNHEDATKISPSNFRIGNHHKEYLLKERLGQRERSISKISES
jgi:hypothetical protein